MKRRNQLGVSLMELMVVMVVVAILAAIAYPSYRQHVIRTNRSDAKVILSQRAQQLERCFTRAQTYVGCIALPETTAGGTYRVTFAAGMPTQDQFGLVATPLAGQAEDTRCGAFQLDETNSRTVTGAATDCWAR